MGKQKKKRLFDDLVGVFDDLVEHDAPVKKIPTHREIDRSLIMFWRREKCSRCRSVYEGSAYHNEPMLKTEVQTPILHFGKVYGWRHKSIVIKPVPDFTCYDHLPRELEIIETRIRVCRKCVHRKNVIYLPMEVPDDAA